MTRSWRVMPTCPIREYFARNSCEVPAKLSVWQKWKVLYQILYPHYIYPYVKLLFTTICFVGFYSVLNLIVIIFNLLYPIFIVGFHCKGCVIERVVWRLKHLKTEEGFASILRLSIPQSISCSLHMLECKESGQMETAVSREYIAGKAFLRGILFCQPV